MKKYFALLSFIIASSLVSIAPAQDFGHQSASETIYMDFGLLPVSASRKQTFRISNNGQTTITQLKSSISGDSFSAKSSCKSTLAPGAYCDYVIEFWCIREGQAKGLLQITSSDLNYMIYLSGMGNRVNYPEPNPPIPPIPHF